MSDARISRSLVVFAVIAGVATVRLPAPYPGTVVRSLWVAWVALWVVEVVARRLSRQPVRCLERWTWSSLLVLGLFWLFPLVALATPLPSDAAAQTFMAMVSAGLAGCPCYGSISMLTNVYFVLSKTPPTLASEPPADLGRG